MFLCLMHSIGLMMQQTFLIGKLGLPKCKHTAILPNAKFQPRTALKESSDARRVCQSHPMETFHSLLWTLRCLIVYVTYWWRKVLHLKIEIHQVLSDCMKICAVECGSLLG